MVRGMEMDLQLKGKSVLVTAGSKGLGKAIAAEYVAQGANVLIGSRHEENLQQAVYDIKETTGDRKSTRLNSSHVSISYAVFCLKKKNKLNRNLVRCDNTITKELQQSE